MLSDVIFERPLHKNQIPDTRFSYRLPRAFAEFCGDPEDARVATLWDVEEHCVFGDYRACLGRFGHLRGVGCVLCDYAGSVTLHGSAISTVTRSRSESSA